MKRLFLIPLAAIMLSACSDDDDSSSSGGGEAEEVGSLQVVMTYSTEGADSLVLSGATSGASLHHSISSPSGGSDSADFEDLAVGEWTLEAYLYQDGEILEQSLGSTVTVKEGETAYKSLALELLEGEPSGDSTATEASSSAEVEAETGTSSESTAASSSSVVTAVSSSSTEITTESSSSEVSGDESSSSEVAGEASSSSEVTETVYGSPRAPEAGEVVISEIYTHYSPASDRFIELYNASSTDSLLLDDCVVRNPSTSSPNKTALDGITIPPNGYYSLGGESAAGVDNTTLNGSVVPYNTDKAVMIVCGDATIDSVYFSYTADASSCAAAYVPAPKDISSHLTVSDLANRSSYTAWCYSAESTPGAAAPSDCTPFECTEASE